MTQRNTAALGVIGGLGPMASAWFMELVTRMTDARVDQEHLDMILYSAPSIPDRSAFLLGNSSQSPLPEMIRIGQSLAAQKVGCIAIPCITAHFFHEELSRSIPAPILHGIEATAEHLEENGIARVGIMATDGTLAKGLFQQVLEQRGISCAVPSPEAQRAVMSLIYEDVKADRPVDLERFFSVSRELKSRQVQAIVLGCTELSLIKRDHPIGPGFIDTLEVLARKAVLHCGGLLRKEYGCLISK